MVCWLYWLLISTLADTYHLSVAPHDCTGPVNVWSALHLGAAVSNAMVLETVRGFCEGYYLDLLTKPLPIREGQMICESDRGLGVRLRPEVLSRFDIKRRISQ